MSEALLPDDRTPRPPRRRVRALPLVIGAVTLYATQMIFSLPVGQVVEQILSDVYASQPELWRPELNLEPPDTRALLPMWVGFGVLGAAMHALLYLVLRPALSGPGFLRGLQYALIATTIQGILMLGLFGIMAVPGVVWLAWWLQRLFVFALGGAVMGHVLARFE